MSTSKNTTSRDGKTIPVTRRDREEVNVNNMRKLFALAMIALLALGLSVAVMGCGQQAAQEETAAPPATETMSAPDTSMMMDTTMADTTTTPSH